MNAVDGKKRCSRCKSIQAVGEFYRNSQSSDGLHTWCKKCVKENNNKNYDKDKWREYFLNNREHYENYANEYYEQNKYKVAERCRKYNRKNKDRLAKNHAIWCKKNPQAIEAHNSVYKALKEGTLVKLHECECCCKKGSTEAHHEDYNFHLNVLWLCRACHRRYHKNLREDHILKIKNLYKEKFNK